jgi:hypothetical protein
VIFCSVNESGRKKSNWIKSLPIGARFVTRRLKPLLVGKVVAIQPGRGKKAVAHAKVIFCQKRDDWDWSGVRHPLFDYEQEVYLEGFRTWQGLLNYFSNHEINIFDTWRIELEKVK